MSCYPEIVDRETWRAAREELLVREKAHTREGDAIAAARRRLPMVEVDATLAGRPARTGSCRCSTCSRAAASSSPTSTCGTTARRPPTSARAARSSTARCASCPRCTPAASPTPRSARAPTTSATATASSWAGTCPGTRLAPSLDALMAGRSPAQLVCYLRDGDRVFETYATGTGRGFEQPMGPAYGLLDLTVYGRQEPWEDSPEGWPQPLEGRTRSAWTGVRSRSGRGSPRGVPTTWTADPCPIRQVPVLPAYTCCPTPRAA